MSATPPDVFLHVHGRPFCLNRKLLVARSGKFASLLMKGNNQKEEPISYSLTDIPCDSTTFEQVVRFFHGFDISLSASNVVPIISVAQYLDMSDLFNKALTFFQAKVLPQWDECVKALISASAGQVFEQMLQLGLLKSCVNSLVGKARISPQLLGEPIQNPTHVDDDDDDDGYMPNAKRRLFVLECKSESSSEEDLTALPLGLYGPVMLTMIQAGVRSAYVVGSLYRYMKKHINHESLDGDVDGDESDEQVYNKNSFQREVIETVEKLLPDETGLIPCKLLSEMLQSAIALQASSNCKHCLEIRLGKQLNEASVEDLLIASQGYAKEMQYDIECFKRILKAFYANCTSRSDPSGMISVAELVEEFLMKVASDEELKKDTFISLADMTEKISVATNRRSDRIYHAIDIYLDKHRNLTESEREDVCQVLDCYKMSSEACTHAAQNKRLPLRVVVQALFVGQLHLRDAIINRIEYSDYGSQKGDMVAVDGDVDHGEEEDVRVEMEMERMDSKVMELEKECSKMKGQIEKGRGKGKLNMWKQLKRKFGCMSSSSHEYNCHVRKKVHSGK